MSNYAIRTADAEIVQVCAETIRAFAAYPEITSYVMEKTRKLVFSRLSYENFSDTRDDWASAAYFRALEGIYGELTKTDGDEADIAESLDLDKWCIFATNNVSLRAFDAYKVKVATLDNWAPGDDAETDIVVENALNREAQLTQKGINADIAREVLGAALSRLHRSSLKFYDIVVMSSYVDTWTGNHDIDENGRTVTITRKARVRKGLDVQIVRPKANQLAWILGDLSEGDNLTPGKRARYVRDIELAFDALEKHAKAFMSDLYEVLGYVPSEMTDEVRALCDREARIGRDYASGIKPNLSLFDRVPGGLVKGRGHRPNMGETVEVVKTVKEATPEDIYMNSAKEAKLVNMAHNSPIDNRTYRPIKGVTPGIASGALTGK